MDSVVSVNHRSSGWVTKDGSVVRLCVQLLGSVVSSNFIILNF